MRHIAVVTILFDCALGHKNAWKDASEMIMRAFLAAPHVCATKAGNGGELGSASMKETDH